LRCDMGTVWNNICAIADSCAAAGSTNTCMQLFQYRNTCNCILGGLYSTDTPAAATSP
jgi:hypothetical protein